MRSFQIICMLAMVWVSAAKEPTFSPGVKLKANGKEISIRRGHLVPVIADWNGDRKRDLIVGHYYGPDGNVKLYLNIGTDARPVYAAAKPMLAGGKPIRLDGA